MSILKTETNVHNTYGNDDPTCPYCGEKQGDYWRESLRYEDGHTDELTCDNCERPFNVTVNISPTFTTNCLDAEHEMVTDGEYKDVAGTQQRYLKCKNCEHTGWYGDDEAKTFKSVEVSETFDI